jgi:hypothetical protein
VAGAPDRTHDFDIDLPDGRRIALEVTTIANPDVISFAKAVRDPTWWAASELQTDWAVSLPGPDDDRKAIKVKAARSTIVSALVALEANGVPELKHHMLDLWAPLPDSTPPAVREAITKLVSVGVGYVRAWGRSDDQVAHVWFMVNSGAVGDSEQLNDYVVDVAKDNAEKLAAAKASKRHLFVWVGGSRSGAEMAFSLLSPPPAPTAIPPAIDVVWLARLGDPTPLWRLEPPGGWEVLDE